MGKEIERKYLVNGDDWRNLFQRKVEIKQGYFEGAESYSLRIRVMGGQAFLTLKKGSGLCRSEYEYEIPYEDGVEMMAEFCEKRVVEKTRYDVFVDGMKWEIDEYSGRHQGLVIAEIELDSIEEVPALPAWVGEEVTGEKRYSNQALAQS